MNNNNSFAGSLNGSRSGLQVNNPIIRIENSVSRLYPDQAKKAKHPEFKTVEPYEFDVTKLRPWFHPEQLKGGICGTRGTIIYEGLRVGNLLASCLNLADILAIQAKGRAFYRHYFAGKRLCAWAAVAWDERGRESLVPYIHEYRSEVILGSHWIEGDGELGLDSPALLKR